MSKALFLSAAVVLAAMVCGLVSQINLDGSVQALPQPETQLQTKQIEEMQAEIDRLRVESETLRQQNQVLKDALVDERDDLIRFIAANRALRNENLLLAQELEHYRQVAAQGGQPQALLAP